MVAVPAARHASGQFVDSKSWTCRYQRNNKRSGLKNLRCFPFCSESHRLRGFCGRSVQFKFSGNVENRNLFAFAEFRKVITLADTAQGKVAKEEVKVGQVLTAKQVEARCRTKEDAFRPWYEGEVPSEDARMKDVVIFEFNRHKKGWNYGWVANKHTCDSEHVLRSYVFERLPDTTYKCVFALDSPRFTLFCRRRQRQNLTDLPPQLRKQLDMQAAMKKKKDIKVEPTRAPQNQKRKVSDSTPFMQDLGSNQWNSPFFDECSMFLPAPQAWSETHELATPPAKKSKLKQQINPEKRDEIVWKIIQGLLKLDMSKKETTKQKSEESVTAKTDDLSAFEDLNFTGYLDSLMPDGWDTGLFDDSLSDHSSRQSTTSTSTDFGVLEDFFEPLHVEMSDLTAKDSNNKEKKRGSLLEELAKFLIEEDCFTKAIEKAFTSADTEGRSFVERKRTLIDIFAEQVEFFLDRNGACMNDLEKLVKSNKKSKKKVSKGISTQIESYSPRGTSFKDTTSKVWERQSPNLVNLSGTWKRDAETLKIMEKVRSDIGVPWIIRKLYKKMESEFIIYMNDLVLELKYANKLMSSGTCKYILDGKVRGFNLACPLPLQESDRVSYCAYRQNDKVMLIHNYDQYNRVRREIHIADDGSKLESTMSHEVRKKGSKDWNETGRWITRAFKHSTAI